MEIIYLLIVLTVSGKQSFQKHEYHTLAEKWKLDIPCEEYIAQKKSQTEIRKKLKLGKQGFETYCVSATQLEAKISELKGVKMETSQPSSQNEDKIEKKENVVGELYKKTNEGRGKSYEGEGGYLGTNYFLRTADNGMVALHPTDKVSKEKFESLLNTKVILSGEYFEKSPNPMEQYPITMDPFTGKSTPVKRTGIRVHSIEKAP